MSFKYTRGWGMHELGNVMFVPIVNQINEEVSASIQDKISFEVADAVWKRVRVFSFDIFLLGK